MKVNRRNHKAPVGDPKMGYEMSFTDNKCAMLSHVGNIYLLDGGQTEEEAVGIVEKKQCRDILVDLREHGIEFGAIEEYALALGLVTVVGKGVRVAIVTRACPASAIEFLRSRARTDGMSLKVFDDFETAANWLLGRGGADSEQSPGADDRDQGGE